MNFSEAAAPASTAQARPSVAKLRRSLSLRTRLALLVTLAVGFTIGVQAIIEIGIFERTVRRDLLENARLSAVAVADDFELRREPIDVDSLAEMLHEFAISAPAIRAISVIDVSGDEPEVIASTSSFERPADAQAARRAVAERDTITIDDRPGVAIVATPALREGRASAAAVVTVSLGSVAQLRTKGRRVTLWFAPIVVVLLTLLIDWFARRLIHQPVARIHTAMQTAGAGDFSARASIIRPDEIGEVAAGLNEMLARLQDFNIALQDKIAEATAELRLRNQELVESYRRAVALREALARAEQMAAVGQTAASVAHQVGTPLNLISGYVQMLQQDAAIDPKTARRLAIVQEQIAKVDAVVRTMLDHARRPDTRWPTSVRTLLTRVADVARPKLDASKIGLTLDIAADLPSIDADAEELELALLNLVNNSLDAMPGGGSLTLAASVDDGRVRITITDSGSGIEPELLPRIFDPWVTTKAAGKGTGLGLSITRDVIARHGGTISAESAPGRTTFAIVLPSPDTRDNSEEHVQDSDRR